MVITKGFKEVFCAMEFSELIKILVMLCPLVFVAGFVDAVAGGGGLIGFPAYMWTGLPIHTIYGCNKFQCTLGTVSSLIRFEKNGILDKSTALVSAITAVIFSAIGTKIILLLSEDVLSRALTIALPVFSVTMLINPKDSLNTVSQAPKCQKTVLFSALSGMLIGLYDSMFGPGGGTLGMLLLIRLFKYDYKTASANIKVILIASSLASAIGHVISGNVLYSVAIPATIFNIWGSYVGAGFAIKHGKKVIKPMANAVVAVVLIKYVVLPLLS